MEKSKERIGWIDLARCFAIMAVVLCHSTESVYSLNGNFMMGISAQSRIFGITSFSIGRIGVPLFLFITGYLLLDRQYDTKNWLDFWKHRFLPLLIITEIWIIIYDLFLMWFNGTSFTLIDLLLNMLFLKNVDMSHMWYMPMILGIYLFLPLLANCLQKMNKKILYILLGIIFAYTMIVPMLSIWRQITSDESLTSELVDLQFLGGYYGLYLIAGWLVKRGDFDKIKTWILCISGILMFILTVGIQLCFYQNDHEYNVWYNNAFLMLCTLCIFLLISRIPQIPLQRCTQDIALKSFGIYLVHNPVKMLVLKYFNITETALIMPLKVGLLFIITFIISWIIVTLILKIPKAGKFIVGVR